MLNHYIKSFYLDRDSKDRIIYLRLQKKAYDDYYSSTANNKYHKNNSTSMGWKNKALYAFGYYNSVSLYKPTEFTSDFYRKHFLCDYPFEKKLITGDSEQWVSLFPMQDKYTYNDQSTEGVDWFDNTWERYPFLGIILISLGKNEDRILLGMDYESLLLEYSAKLNHFIKEQIKQSFRGSMHYSLNCADLCLMLQTSSLPFIHRIKVEAERIAAESNCEINATVIFAAEPSAALNCEALLQENQGRVQFVVRSKNKYIDPDESYGVNGVGKYVTVLSYSKYAQVFEARNSKTEKEYSKFAKSICHEREWFIDEKSNESTESPKVPPDGLRERKNYITTIENKISTVKESASRILDPVSQPLKSRFFRSYNLLNNLVLTYSELFYRSVSESSFVFMMHIWIVLDGIEHFLKRLKVVKYENEFFDLSVENLIETIHNIVCDLNGYNKQLLFMNQDSVNFPNREIFTNVNSEKYMAAYSSFLHFYLATYHRHEKLNQKKLIKYFPVALVNVNQQTIIEHLFFTEVYKEKSLEANKGHRALLTVHFPGSEAFADLTNSIPLLMHEIAHVQVFGKVEDRNKAFMESINRFFSEYFSDAIMSVLKGNSVLGEPVELSLNKVLNDGIYASIKKMQKELSEKEEKDLFDSCQYNDLIHNSLSFYKRIVDYSDVKKGITNYNSSKFIALIKDDIEYLLNIVKKNQFLSGGQKGVQELTEKELIIEFWYVIINMAEENIIDNEGKIGYKKKTDFYNKEVKTILNRFKRISGLKEKGISSSYDEYLHYLLFCYNAYSTGKQVIVERTCDRSDIDIVLSTLSVDLAKKITQRYNLRYEMLEKEIFNSAFRADELFDLERINNSLRELFTQKKENNKMDEFDLKELEMMFIEFIETSVRLLRVVEFFDSQSSLIKTEKTLFEEFASNVFSFCNKKIESIEKEDDFIGWLFTENHRKELAQLGLLSRSKEIDNLAQILRETFLTIGDNIDELINEREELFKEVFADCGMCSAIGFDAYGYCLFTVGIYHWWNRTSSNDGVARFLTDRLKTMLYVLLRQGETKDKVKETNSFIHKIMNRDIICGIINEIKSNKTDFVQSKIEDLKKTINEFKIECEWTLNEETYAALTKWKEEVVEKLIVLLNETEDNCSDKSKCAVDYLTRTSVLIQILIEEDILLQIENAEKFQDTNFGNYFVNLIELMNNNEANKSLKENEPLVVEIRNYFNMPFSNSSENSYEKYYSSMRDLFFSQCNFVFKYYCLHRSACLAVKEYQNTKQDRNVAHETRISDWFDIMDDFYSRRNER